MAIFKERKYIGLLLLIAGMVFSFLVASTNFTYDVMVFLTRRPDPPRELTLWFIFYWCCIWIMSVGMRIWLKASRGLKNKTPWGLKVCGVGLVLLALMYFYIQFVKSHGCGRLADHYREIYHLMERKIDYMKGVLALLCAMGCFFNIRRLIVYVIAAFLIVQITWWALAHMAFKG